jgi:hypothetical protein
MIMRRVIITNSTENNSQEPLSGKNYPRLSMQSAVNPS